MAAFEEKMELWWNDEVLCVLEPQDEYGDYYRIPALAIENFKYLELCEGDKFEVKLVEREV